MQSELIYQHFAELYPLPKQCKILIKSIYQNISAAIHDNLSQKLE